MNLDRSAATKAGWYPDPDGGQLLRYWDGSAWAPRVGNPARLVGSTQAAGGTIRGAINPSWNTSWIWLTLFLPLVPVMPLLFVDWGLLLAVDPVTMQADVAGQLELFTSPAYLASALCGWLVYALTVLTAYLDCRTLADRDIPRPFHWAWAILSPIVYGVGRGVVTNRRIGRGLPVVGAAIGAVAINFTIGVMVVVSAVVTLLAQGAVSVPLG